MNASPDIAREIASTGRLRVALNMGNPVLARSQTSSERPAGVTIDLGRRFAALLGVKADFLECASAGVAGSAIAADEADVGFMAIDPQRAETLHFSAPYVQIEGWYVVRAGSPLRRLEDVDRAGIRVVAGKGSAYGLFLHRELRQAQMVDVPTSEEVADKLLADPALDVAAGVLQQLETDIRRHPQLRLLPGAFMTIRQAMTMANKHSPAAKQCMERFMQEQRSSGFIREALARHGMEGVTVLG